MPSFLSGVFHGAQQKVLHTSDQYDGQASPNSFAILRKRWLDQIVGQPDIDRSEPLIQTAIKTISDNGNTLLRRYRITSNQVFDRISPLSGKDAKFKETYGKLLQLAISWATQGTDHYQQQDVLEKIIAGMDLVHTLVYNENLQIINRQNWWAIQIGAPQHLCDLCIVLYDHLGPQRLRSYGRTIIKQVGSTDNPSLKGGNRGGTARILITTGIFLNDASVLRQGVATLSAEGRPETRKNTLFGYAQPGAGEGLYEDGSLISHDVYPYAGGYGLVMLTALAAMINLLNSPESPPEFRITDPGVNITYESVERNFFPVVWNGLVFDHVRGREISRETSRDWGTGHALIHTTVSLSRGCPDGMSKRLQSLIRLWVQNNPVDILHSSSLTQISALLPIIRSSSVPISQRPLGAFCTPIQERFTYHGKNSPWCFSLAMASKRVGRAECLNDENHQRSWYQGDGMTYFYNECHKTHYSDDFWPTVDPLHLPGTTNHQSIPPQPVYKSTGFRDWSGGVCWAGGGGGNGTALGANNMGARLAAASLDHYSFDKRSAAKKSWFMLDDAVIALGAGCTGNAQSPLHTTVENRNLGQSGKRLFINGQEQATSSPWNTKTQASWAWLEETGGYQFLAPLPTIFEREKRSGKWSDINCNGDSRRLCEREYVKIIVDHGVDPKSSEYAYAVLPGKSLEDMQQIMQKQPMWEIIRNDVNVQAIHNRFYSPTGEALLATFWTAGSIEYRTSTAVETISASHPCQIIWGIRTFDVGGAEEVMEAVLSVADPTHHTNQVGIRINGNDFRNFVVQYASSGVQGNGADITFDGLKDGVTKSIIFHFRRAKGQSHDEL